MSTPGQPNYPGDNPPNSGGQSPYSGGQPYQPGAGNPGDPYAAGPPGYPGQPGYPGKGGQPGYPGQPGQQGGYPGQQQGYPGQQQGYPGPQGGYPQGGYPQGGYPPPPGGYPGQQGGYPGQPTYPGGPGGYQGAYPGGAGLPAAPARPNTITYAFGCWMASIVVSLIGLVITLTSPIWDQAVAAGLRTSGNVTFDVQSVVTTAKVFLVGVFLVFAAVYLLFAFKMYVGRNWARIVLTVFGALSVLSAFTPTSRSVTVNSQVFDVNSGQWATYLTAALAVAGIVLMYLAPSNKYFAASKAQRQQIRG